ncbi:MAG: hypothetical protein PHE06_01035 [Lachnospiraceae bacterium]|nr:hypothetical protein [Lachnospiraceae bacterium]MDD3794552.1 hypothetical protein [Lachnospiraceae bacterium]
MSGSFPTTKVGGIELPRLIIGCNWISGWSHRTPSKDDLILSRHNQPESVSNIFSTFMREEVNAVLGLFGVDHDLIDAVHLAEQKTGKSMTILDTVVINVDDTASARKEAENTIKESARRGTKICLPLHSCVEQLLNKNKQTIERLPDYLYMIREAGMVPGLSAHMPEVIQYSDKNEYDVETYIQIFNCMGFLMQVEIESVAKIIHNAKKPVITIKPCAAGRTTPYVGLNFSFNAIREQDMVCIGCFTSNEAMEDIEYAKAALERRLPNIGARQSPFNTSVIKGKLGS